jgi:hypothetical protein
MNFRRCITALAVLALFAGFASAQVATSTAGSGGTFACQASVAVPPTLRAEGLTELIGDIVLTCTGGTQISVPATGALTALPTANVTVSLGANVTSRLLSYPLATTSTTLASNTSEALLLIDEPGSGDTMGSSTCTPGTTGLPGCPVAGYGPSAAQILCTVPGGTAGQPASLVGAGPGGCIEYAQQLTASGTGDYVMSSTSTVSATPTAGANVFAGVASANQVTFYGIPILPPASAGVARIFRITNVRLNANALAGGGLAGTQSVVASISISGNTSVLVNSPTPIVGFIQSGLSASLRNNGNAGGGSSATFSQCSSASVGNGGNLDIVRFSENFGTAFKTRVSPTASTSGQAVVLQNVPGFSYNSESGFVTSLMSGTSYGISAGLADYGTRLKAVFNNVPAGVTIYVSTTNVVNLYTSGGAMAQPAINSSSSFAQLVLTETTPDTGGIAPVVPATAYVTYTSGSTTANAIGYAPVSVNSAGQGVAVWEVINTNPSTVENFDFGVYASYTANAAGNSPPPTGSTPATVTLSFAPTATELAFPASAAVAASSTLTLPRFSDAASSATSLFSIALCTTNLLFPFVTNQAGFDTGIALLNTTSDPFGTAAQQGTCTMYFYGNNAPANFVTPVITPGLGVNTSPAGNWAFMASNIAPNFEGYMIAICNFQLAHGYAFVSDVGAQKLAHGYLALILGNGTSKRAVGQSISGVEALEN